MRAELAARESALQLTEENAARERADLESRATELAAAEQRNAGTERRAAELDDRVTLLAAREAELTDSLAALERRERKLDELRSELEVEQNRLAGRARKLAEAERRAPVPEPAMSARTFSEGLKVLSQRRAG
jgi:chromosome segregation ATPase